jgi:hypothetical protein
MLIRVVVADEWRSDLSVWDMAIYKEYLEGPSTFHLCGSVYGYEEWDHKRVDESICICNGKMYTRIQSFHINVPKTGTVAFLG